MSHDPTECSLGVTIVIDVSRFMRIHNSVLSPFLVVHPSVIGSVCDEGILCPGAIVVWTAGQKVQRDSVLVLGERVGKAPVGVLRTLFAAALRWISVLEEDTVLSG